MIEIDRLLLRRGCLHDQSYGGRIVKLKAALHDGEQLGALHIRQRAVDHADMHEQCRGRQPIVAFLEATWILVAAGQFRHEVFERLEIEPSCEKARLILAQKGRIANSEWRIGISGMRIAGTMTSTR